MFGLGSLGRLVSSVGSWLGRAGGSALTLTPPRLSISDLAQDQVVSDFFQGPYRGPLDLDEAGAETEEMRRVYRELYRKEPTVRAAVRGLVNSVACLDVSVIPNDLECPEDNEDAEFVRWAVEQSDRGWAGIIEDALLPARIDGWAALEIKLKPALWRRPRPKAPRVLRPGLRSGPLTSVLPPPGDGSSPSPFVPPDFPPPRQMWALDRLRSLDTRHLRLQLDVYRNVMGVVNLRRGLEYYPPEKLILVTCSSLFSNPFGQSDLRAIYRSAGLIEQAYKLWYVALKYFGAPYVHGKITNPSNRKLMEEALESLKSAGWAVTSKDDEIALLDLAASASFDAFEKKVNKLREEIFLAVRGAYLPFLQGQGGPNARGNTRVSKRSGSDPEEYLLAKQMGRALTAQLVPRLIEPNFGRPAGCHVSLGGTDWLETKEQLEVTRILIAELGLPVSKKYLYEISQHTPPEDSGDALGPPASGGMGLGGPGVGSGTGRAVATFAAPPHGPPRPGLVWKEETHRWVRPHTGEGHEETLLPSAPSPPAASSPDTPEGVIRAADAQARSILRAVFGLPARAIRRARERVGATYRRLEGRYGAGYAKVIVAAGVAGLPIPLPGASVLMAAPILAVAELHRRLRGVPIPAAGVSLDAIRPAAEQFLVDVGAKSAETPIASPSPASVPVTPPVPAAPVAKGHPLSTLFIRGLAAAGLSAEQRTAYRQAASHVLGRMPKAALDRAHAGLAGVNFHADTRAAGEAAITAGLRTPALTEEQRTKISQLAESVRAGRAVVGGAYVPHERSLHIDGGIPGATSTAGPLLPSNPTHHVYAHELTHAIDGPTYELSRSAEWRAAFAADIAPPGVDPPLTRYATTQPSEGFAEFGRLVYASDVPPATIEARFPRATAFFKARGLWPGAKAMADDSDGARAGEGGPVLGELFAGRFDLGDGGHLDLFAGGDDAGGLREFRDAPPHPGLVRKEIIDSIGRRTHVWVRPDGPGAGGDTRKPSEPAHPPVATGTPAPVSPARADRKAVPTGTPAPVSPARADRKAVPTRPASKDMRAAVKYRDVARSRRVIRAVKNEGELAAAIGGFNFPDSEPADVVYALDAAGRPVTDRDGIRRLLSRRELAVRVLKDRRSAPEQRAAAERVLAQPCEFIEVKTLLTSTVGAVRMSVAARRRKERWIDRYGVAFSVVVFDDRKGSKYSGHRLYVAPNELGATLRVAHLKKADSPAAVLGLIRGGD